MSQQNEVHIIPVSYLKVISCSPGNTDENIPPTQVHILYRVPDLDAYFSMRLKSKEVVDEIIAALIEHRDNVWGQ